ncbi:aspartate kinase [Perlabentimonas gracilis]|uniref:aspartate kinase n=1 Tax=Perlabentimonas gracilis TaxID=2715279 RepID=UPI001407D7A9|nr:aspartate kinase [Perlabentimonas gracilis]NHB70144.1 aspartate kinase [Perlabentimonas gracilis]
MLTIFKFGGASVKDAQGVKNLAEIVRSHPGNMVVVVSAMGKTTNALEQLLAKYIAGDDKVWDDLATIKERHLAIADELFQPDTSNAIAEVDALFSNLKDYLRRQPRKGYNFNYDQIVSYGELISTKIISSYLNAAGICNTWVDIRNVLLTDANFREGNIDFKKSEELSSKQFQFNGKSIYVTQGFIGGTADGHTTTLGREGSDYTAALLANLLDAQSVTIWKDVEGVLNADPRVFPDAIKLHEVSFKEAIELAYCGAQIIHPKTIKPLQNKQIPLYVKSFANPVATGTKVYQTEERIGYPPIRIVKTNQVLISLTPRDFSFVIEDCLSRIFAVLYSNRVKANLVQSSAISFSLCVDNEDHFLPGAIRELNSSFEVKYNKGLELLTVRHYSQDVIERMLVDKKVFLQQKTRSTLRAVYQS